MLLLIACSGKKEKPFLFGLNENDQRKALGIPVIEETMIDNKEYLKYAGNRWASAEKYPRKSSEVLHVFKIVTLSKCDTCYERDEWDVFRKLSNQNRQLELDIFNHILNSQHVIRKATLSDLTNMSDTHKRNLSEMETDSICEKWGLFPLILHQNK